MVPLLAVAHGSRDPRAAATVEALLAHVRVRHPGLHVVASYLGHAQPSPGQALGHLADQGVREVAVVPLLLGSAYHARVDIPRALCAAGGVTVHYRPPLGPHPLLIAAAERRLAERGVAPGDPDTAVVLAAAGSTDPAGNAIVGRIAVCWARRGWWRVVPAFASAASPTPAQAVAGLRAAGAPRVVVATYLLAPGHFTEVIRERSYAAGATIVSAPLGAAPEVAEVLMERYAPGRSPWACT